MNKKPLVIISKVMALFLMVIISCSLFPATAIAGEAPKGSLTIKEIIVDTPKVEKGAIIRGTIKFGYHLPPEMGGYPWWICVEDIKVCDEEGREVGGGGADPSCSERGSDESGELTGTFFVCTSVSNFPFRCEGAVSDTGVHTLYIVMTGKQWAWGMAKPWWYYEFTDRKSFTIEVGSVNQPPTCSFEIIPENPTPDDFVSCVSTSTDEDGDPVTCTWHLDDTNIGTGCQIDVGYLAPGEHRISLVCEDPYGFGLPCHKTIEVKYPEMSVSIVFAFLKARQLQTVDFAGEITGGQAPFIYFWNWGDGQETGWQDAVPRLLGSHTWDCPGTYKVVLGVQDDNGVTAKDSREVEVVSYFEQQTGYIYWDILFPWPDDWGNYNVWLANVYPPEGGLPPYTYYWDFGDGSTEWGLDEITHSYSSLGTYTVTLTVFDSCNLSYTSSLILELEDGKGWVRPIITVAYLDSEGNEVSEVGTLVDPCNPNSITLDVYDTLGEYERTITIEGDRLLGYEMVSQIRGGQLCPAQFYIPFRPEEVVTPAIDFAIMFVRDEPRPKNIMFAGGSEVTPNAGGMEQAGWYHFFVSGSEGTVGELGIIFTPGGPGTDGGGDGMGCAQTSSSLPRESFDTSPFLLGGVWMVLLLGRQWKRKRR